MYRIIILFLFIGALSSCSRNKGKTQGDLQRIYLAINEGQLDKVNDMLVPENKLSASPLESDGYTKELYGQVHVLESISIGDDEMVIYKLEKHERNRGVIRRMGTEDFKERQEAGEPASADFYVKAHSAPTRGQRVNRAISNGLWYGHKSLTRSADGRKAW